MNKRERWAEIGVPEGWKVDGPNGEYISNGAKQVWLNDGKWFLIADEIWLPGVYADVATAIAAISAPDEVLSKLNELVCSVYNANRAITADDLNSVLPWARV